jgi:hypothetical protein
MAGKFKWVEPSADVIQDLANDRGLRNETDDAHPLATPAQ